MYLQIIATLIKVLSLNPSTQTVSIILITINYFCNTRSCDSCCYVQKNTRVKKDLDP